jgi:hypothetical protein
MANQEMNTTWNGEAVPALRDELKATIFSLSEEWKNTTRGTKRPLDADANGQGSGSDHEVEGLLETNTDKPPNTPVSEDDEPVLVEYKSVPKKPRLRKGRLR